MPFDRHCNHQWPCAEDEKLIGELHARISRMALYYARCSGVDADDLLQDAWLSVLEARRTYNPSLGPLRPWLVRSARWRMLDVIKHQRFRKSPFVDGASSEPAGEWQRSDEPLEMREFIEALKPLQQRIVRCLLRGGTWRDAGEELGCTSANIAYHMRDIRQRYEMWNRSNASLAPAGTESN